MEMVSAAEKKALEDKLAALLANRPVMAKRIAEARALGDLKENADYHAARDDQGLEEAEIRRLQEKLKSVIVVDDAQIPADMVFLGTVCKLRDIETEREGVYKLVGEASGNFDSDEMEVTVQSPMGEALMKSRIGETIRVDGPRGVKRYEVVEIL